MSKIGRVKGLTCIGSKKPIELTAWEVKSDSVSAETLQIQLRKDIRTNASVMDKLEQSLDMSFPRPAPIVLDIIGSRALAYIVRKIEPGFFGARSAEEIIDFLNNGNLPKAQG
ncbi:hypothetical protein BGZ76_007468 [Entomortierella beljakovae]|nr:hypothetical protein BGZ76_007468 [Entomortierella beljakovae]